MSLQTRLLEIHYVDIATGIDETRRGAALEDIEDAAKRLGLEVVDPDPNSYRIPWYAWNELDASNTLAYSIARSLWIKEYQKIQEANPGGSKEELSIKLKLYLDEHKDQLFGEIQDTLTKKLPNFEKETRSFQQDILSRTEKSTAMRLVLFNIMIGNSDWNHFGLNPTTTSYAMRNVGIFKTIDGTVFPFPYDFDLSRIVKGRIPTKQEFQTEMTTFWSANARALPAYFSGFDQESEKNRLLAKRDALIDLISRLSLEAADKEILSSTVVTFFDALHDFSFPVN